VIVGDLATIRGHHFRRLYLWDFLAITKSATSLRGRNYCTADETAVGAPRDSARSSAGPFRRLKLSAPRIRPT
jgi:hypothetical protein